MGKRRKVELIRPRNLVSTFLVFTILILLANTVASSSRFLQNLPDTMGEYNTRSGAVTIPEPKSSSSFPKVVKRMLRTGAACTNCGCDYCGFKPAKRVP
ncbi:unnamed protein product [Calypogeia fissa]